MPTYTTTSTPPLTPANNSGLVLKVPRKAFVGPRILVPIVVEALVVDGRNEAGPDKKGWAETRLDEPVHGKTGAPGTAIPTFPVRPGTSATTPWARPFGVHLHWALPDGLTRGRVGSSQPGSSSAGGEGDDASVVQETMPASPRLSPGQDPKAPPITPRPALQVSRGSLRQPSVHDLTSTGKAPAPTAPRFSLVPDRWLVLRISSPSSGAQASGTRSITGWVIQLEDRIVEGKAQLSTPKVVPIDQWIAETPDDPRPRWFTPLGRGGDAPFTAYYDNVEKVLGFHDNLAAEPGVKGPISYLVTGWYSRPEEDPTFDPVGRGFQTLLREHPEFMGMLGAYGECLDAIQQDLGFRLAPDRTAALKAHTEWMQRRGQDSSTLSQREGFANVLCHGMIYDVPWLDGPVRYADQKSVSNVPASTQISVAVGNSAGEALAAVLARTAKADALEPLLTALQLGQVEALSGPDAQTKLETLLHTHAFAQHDAGATWEDAGPAPVDQGGPTKRIWRKRPLPRFFSPTDPVLVLLGAGRGYKHGADGRFESDGTLACRFTGQTLQALPVPVGSLALENPLLDATLRDRMRTDPRKTLEIYALFSTFPVLAQPAMSFLGELVGPKLPTLKAVPVECVDLLIEALLLDESTALAIAERLVGWTASSNKWNGEAVATTANALEPVVRYHQQRWRRGGIDLTRAAREVAYWPEEYLKQMQAQVPPSPVGVQLWKAPWTPLHLEWEVQYCPTPRSLAQDWALAENDYVLIDQAPHPYGKNTLTLKGRTLLTPAPARVFEGTLRTLLQAEQSGKDELTAEQEVQLETTRRMLEELDVLSTSLGDFHQQLQTAIQLGMPSPGIHASWRAGHGVIANLRVVDAFGQYVQLPSKRITSPFSATTLSQTVVRAEALEPWALPALSSGAAQLSAASLRSESHVIQLPPRLWGPARLMLRLLDASDPTQQREAGYGLDKGPIAGWIVPDHLDQALELYDRNGKSLGQLVQDGRSANLFLEPVPGSESDEGSVEAGLQAHGHLIGFVKGLKSRALEATRTSSTPTVLEALLRMIDSTRWTMEPLGDEALEHLAAIAGHPLALVRAKVSIEMPKAAADRMVGQKMNVRLGDLTSLQDGLIGYFVEDPAQPQNTYQTFYPVHESMASEALPVLGPNLTFYGAVGDAQSTALKAETLRHPYLSAAPFVFLEPNKPVNVTLLVDPRGGVHATCGFLPRKRIDLPKEHYEAALKNMALTFRVGPVLVDPSALRLPVPGGEGNGRTWLQQSSPASWAPETRILPADEQPRFGGMKPRLVEGWIRTQAGAQTK